MPKLWGDATVNAIQESYDHARRAERAELREIFDLMIAYTRGEMKPDTEALLFERYPQAQRGPYGARIGAVTLPLFQAYLDEIATVYSGDVSFELKNENGETNEEATRIYTDAMQELEYDQIMAEAERIMVAGKAVGQLWQLVDGKIDCQVYEPQDVYPVSPPDEVGENFNPANQDTYLGFDLDVRLHERSADGKKRPVFTFVGRGGHVQYTGKHISDLGTVIAESSHAYQWDGRPLNMFTLLYESKPIDRLLHFYEHPLYTDNRELNVLWSVLLNVMRYQAGATPVLSLPVNDQAPASAPTGPMFPIVLEGGETFAYAQAGNDYTGLIAGLQNFAKLVGVTMSLAPSDYSTEETKAQSGFAKIIENLPKIRKRTRRSKWFRTQERTRVYPRVASLLAASGKGSLAMWQALKLHATFKGEEIPLSVQERTQQEDHDIELGLTTAAELLAERKGITVEEAEVIVADNLAKKPKAAQPQSPFGGGALPQRVQVANLIGGGAKERPTNGQQDNPRNTTRQR